MCVVVVFVRKNHLRTLVQKLTFVFSRKQAHFIEKEKGLGCYSYSFSISLKLAKLLRQTVKFLANGESVTDSDTHADSNVCPLKQPPYGRSLRSLPLVEQE